MEVVKEMELGGRTLKFTLGRTAAQANGAAWVQYGDTVLHIAAVSSSNVREGLDFLPLMVDYREKFFAAGRIPGGFFKREGRPHEKEILSARMIDRPIRPLFPDGYRYDTQLMASVWSADLENDADILGPIAASLALNVSDIPFADVIASVRVGLIDGNYIINPTNEQLGMSQMDLVVVGSETEITMVEGHGKEISNQVLIDALAYGHEHIRKIVQFQNEILDGQRQPKREFIPPERDEELAAKVEKLALDEIRKIALITDKTERKQRRTDLIDKVMEATDAEELEIVSDVKGFIKDILKAEVRGNVLKDNHRIDGRTNTDIREITCEVGVLPRVHGSALFRRGQTQALGTATLGTKLDEQRIDNVDLQGFQRYMLHYTFPPFSTGETKSFFGVSRREVGHGKLGERAIEATLPAWDDFPYTIRVTSDILESNGSSSMASVCACSLALMDAGVPLKKAVAGIAMGLIMEGDKYSILTDILGDEDHLGDMDFKVAGTRDGITAFQMDIKIGGISSELMAEALTQARDARHHILDIMDKTLSSPRPEVNSLAPKFITVQIPIDRIGALIGPGGKIIRQIVADTGATIDVEDDGTVRIGAVDRETGEAARAAVEEVTAVPEAGKIYEGLVKKVTDFGAFVEIIPGTEGLLHISQIENRRIDRVEDVIKLGDMVKVKLLSVSLDGKLELSRRVLLDDYDESKDVPRRRPNRDNRGGGGRDRGGFRRR